MKLCPLRFRPVYKDYLWGGDRIVKKYGRVAPEGIYAESWEVSDREEGMSVVAEGPFRDETLQSLIEAYPEQMLGNDVTDDGRFPLLIKLIDSQKKLSVQVHPSDDTASRTGGEPKTEMWYLLEAAPDASVIAGLKEGVGEEELRRTLDEGQVPELLENVPVETGDAVYMPGGRVHAICEGCLIMEVQQNSNTTYRLYDWDRLGADGKPRELHIEEAMQVIEWQDEGEVKPQARLMESAGANEVWEVLESPCFVMDRIELREEMECESSGGHFRVFFCVAGEVDIAWDGGAFRFSPGTTVFVPAGLRKFVLNPAESAATLLRTGTIGVKGKDATSP